MTVYKDTMTAFEKSQLKAYLIAQEIKGKNSQPVEPEPPTVNPSLASQEPCFGRYTPDLLFSSDAAWHWHHERPAIDPHYFAINGDAPDDSRAALEGAQREGMVAAALATLILATTAVMALWAFFSIVLPWLTSCYIHMTGC